MSVILSDAARADLMDLVNLARHGRPVPLELSGRALHALALAPLAPPAPHRLQLIRNDDGTFSTTGGTWTPRRTDAAAILAACAAAPGRWLPTWPDTAVRAAQGRLVRCIDDLSAVDPALAHALRPARSADAPGLRLRLTDGIVQARLRLSKGACVNTGVPLP